MHNRKISTIKFKDLNEPIRDLVTNLLVTASPPEKRLEVHGISNLASEMRDYISLQMCFDEDIE